MFPIKKFSQFQDIDYRSSSWGWGTWLDRWREIDWNVKDFDEFKRNKNIQKLFNRSGKNLTEMLFMQKAGKIDSWAILRTYSRTSVLMVPVFIVALLTNYLLN